MGAFEYVAVDACGRERKGVLEGDTPRHVRQLLREQSLLPVAVTEVAEQDSAPAQRAAAVRSSQRRPERADLVADHAPARDAGEIRAAARGSAARGLAADRQATRPQHHARACARKVMEGHTLADGLAEFPELVPEIYRATIAASEQSGPPRHGARAARRLHREPPGAAAAARSARCCTRCCCSWSASRSCSSCWCTVVPKIVEVFRNSDATLPLLTQIADRGQRLPARVRDLTC